VTAPFYRHNFSISEALARGGVKGGPIPAIVSNVQPVIVMADVSQSYSGEPLEGRGAVAAQSSTTLPAGPVTRAFLRIESRSVGGVVIEDIFAQGNIGSTAVFLDIIPTEALFAREEVEKEILSCGGAAIFSRYFDGRANTPVTGSGPFSFGLTLGARTPFRAFIPPGSSFVAYAADLAGAGNGGISGQIVFREIPQSIGLP